MSTFMVHPQGCISRGKDPLKKSQLDKEWVWRQTYPGVAMHMGACWEEVMVNTNVRAEVTQWVWSLERGGTHRLPTSRWVLGTKQGGCLGKWGLAGLGFEQAMFSPYLNLRPPLRSGIGRNSEASRYSPSHVDDGEETWEKQPQVLVLALLLCYCWSSATHTFSLGLWLCICRMKWGPRRSFPDLTFFESKTKPWRSLHHSAKHLGLK